jgi:hypothetical protein
MSTKNNKIYSYILLLISLFVLVLFTRWQFTNLQISFDEKEQAEINLQSSRDEVSRLNKIETELNSSDVNISKYLNNVTEDNIIDYVYSQIERDNISSSDWIISVRSMSLQEEKTNEFWFKEIWIILNLRVPNENRMYRILDFFVWENSKYKFFIESFSYSNNNTSNVSDSGFNITIPLKVFYK